MVVVVGKKTVRLATARNYIKRVSREVFRLQQHQLAGLDMVIRVRKGFSPIEYVGVSQELRMQFNRACQKFALPEETGDL